METLADYTLMRRNVPLFVYGTLMKGQPLEGWLRNIAIDREPARANGYRLFTQDRAFFPYMVPDDIGTVRGEVVWVEPGSDLNALVDMELGAGYSLSLIDVESEGCTLPVPVLSFTWQRDIPTSWKPIPSNDWTTQRASR